MQHTQQPEDDCLLRVVGSGLFPASVACHRYINQTLLEAEFSRVAFAS